MGVEALSSFLADSVLESVRSSDGNTMLLGVLRGGRAGLMEGILKDIYVSKRRKGVVTKVDSRYVREANLMVERDMVYTVGVEVCEREYRGTDHAARARAQKRKRERREKKPGSEEGWR